MVLIYFCLTHESTDNKAAELTELTLPGLRFTHTCSHMYIHPLPLPPLSLLRFLRFLGVLSGSLGGS